MSSTRENSQAQNFISEIFKIVVENLKSASLNNQEINNLSRIDQNQSVDSLLEKLASKIQDDSAAISTIQSNLEKYKGRIDKAITSTRPPFIPGDF
jgi:peptidoglycan hydrolase-like protein with peptidoglycan-binding domain